MLPGLINCCSQMACSYKLCHLQLALWGVLLRSKVSCPERDSQTIPEQCLISKGPSKTEMDALGNEGAQAEKIRNGHPIQIRHDQ